MWINPRYLGHPHGYYSYKSVFGLTLYNQPSVKKKNKKTEKTELRTHDPCVSRSLLLQHTSFRFVAVRLLL